MSGREKSKKVIGRKNVKRLQNDIIDIIKNPLSEHGIHYIHDDEDILKGYAVIFGPSDTIYRYGCYSFRFEFPTEYPYKPPKLTYLTNDGSTRFHPNLYRNGKVCISILNTWRGEQWTSCQNIRSILLMLVTLLHNKSLLNEPGITEKNKSFKPYHKIIAYKNIEVAILGSLKFLPEKNHTFHYSYKSHIKKNKEEIKKYLVELEESEKEETLTTNIYNMSCNINYNKLNKKVFEVLEDI